MLHFIVPTNRTGIIKRLRKRLDRDLAERIAILTYEALPQQTTLPAGTYIFAGLGVISAVKREIAIEVWSQLAQAGPSVRLLNHPGGVLGRYDLLQKLHEMGRNDFRVYCIAELAERSPRFPVFVREAQHHTGSLTELIPNAEALEQALQDLYQRGYKSHNLLVIEYCHTADETGVYRKYSALKLGKEILPRYLSLSYQWVVKEHSASIGIASDDIYDAAMVAEEMEYIRSNPHRDWLRETFALANIDYGRIDYGIWNGRPQVWEINTHPSFGTYPGERRTQAQDKRKQLRLPAKEHFYQQFVPALKSLVATQAVAPIPISLSKKTWARLVQEQRRARPIRYMKALLRVGASLPRIPLPQPIRQAVKGFFKKRMEMARRRN